MPYRRFALVPLIFLPGPIGCSSPDTNAVGAAYYAGRPQDAEAQLLELLKSDSDGKALYLNELGVIALDRRELDLAYQRFLDASQIMGSFTGTGAKEVGAILGSESSKIWHGDPYEQSMNSYYLGIVNLLRRIDDNALAGFKNAVFLDSSREEKYECDFAPALFLEGYCYELLGDGTMSASSFASARAIDPACRAFDPANHGNLVVVVDAGRGPTKVNVGRHGEATTFLDHAALPPSVTVVVDGKEVGATETAGDVYFQATTRGGRAFDAILEGKAIYKSTANAAGIGALILSGDGGRSDAFQRNAAITGAALLLSSAFVDARADTRHWTTLPARVQLFRGSLAPGAHEIEIVPAGGWRVTGPIKQTVTIPETGGVLVYQRVLP